MLKSNVNIPKSERLRQWFYPESRLSGITICDGTVAFYSQVRALIRPNHTLLDIGCGRGRYGEDQNDFRRHLRIFKGDVANVIGIDVGTAGRHNPYLDEFRMIESGRWPAQDQSIDIAICDYVLEHVEDPNTFFAEATRVLRPGGYFLARTAHAWGYVSIFSRLIPRRLHAKVIAGTQDDRKEEDVFPTFYRCNTRRSLLQLFDNFGFDGIVTTNSSEPSYLGFSSLAYLLGVVHQKLSPPLLHVGLMAFARKR